MLPRVILELFVNAAGFSCFLLLDFKSSLFFCSRFLLRLRRLRDFCYTSGHVICDLYPMLVVRDWGRKGGVRGVGNI